jgi:hypothetical protein
MRDDVSESAVSMRPFAATASSEPSNEEWSMSDWQSSQDTARSAECEPDDQSLVERCREGDQDAATQLYCRYERRLKRLIMRRCSPDLARCASVEDIVQSVFGSTFRWICVGRYAVHEGEELWKLLRVIALNAIRSQATYHYAARRDSRRTTSGTESRLCLELQSSSRGRVSDQFDLAGAGARKRPCRNIGEREGRPIKRIAPFANIIGGSGAENQLLICRTIRARTMARVRGSNSAFGIAWVRPGLAIRGHRGTRSPKHCWSTISF